MTEEPENPLLGFLRARPKASGDAFRTNPRQGTRRRARLAWQDGPTARVVRARLLDISRVGIALSASVPPPSRGVVRVRLAGSAPTPWLEADVVGIEPNDQESYRVRLKFHEPCPTVFLKTAVLGPVASTSEVSAPALESED